MDSDILLNVLRAMLALDRNVTSTIEEIRAVVGHFPMIALHGEKDPHDALTGQDHLEVEALYGALEAYEVGLPLRFVGVRC